MPKSVLSMPYAGATTSEDIVYIIQGTGNNRDRKVCLKDLAQGIIKGSNLPHNTPTIVTGAGVLAQTVYPYGSSEIEAYALQPETVVASGFRNLPLYNEVSDWNSATLPVESRILGSGGTSKSAKIPLSIVTDVSRKVLIHTSAMLEYTIGKMDKHLILFLDSPNDSTFTIHGVLSQGGTLEIRASNSVVVGNGHGMPQQSKNFFGRVLMPDAVGQTTIYVYRSQSELLIRNGTGYIRTPTYPAQEHIVEFHQTADFQADTGSWLGFIPAGVQDAGSLSHRATWISHEAYKIKGYAVSFYFPGGGLLPGQIINMVLKVTVYDTLGNISTETELPLGFANFDSEGILTASSRIAHGEDGYSAHILQGYGMRFRLTYTWQQDGMAMADVIGKITAIFEKLPIQNQFLI